MYSNGIIYNKEATAVIKIFNDLGFPYFMLRELTLIIPRVLRDIIYGLLPKIGIDGLAKEKHVKYQIKIY